jgi:hypothetical protein
MKSSVRKSFFAVPAALLFCTAAPARAQLESLPMMGATNGYATNITSVVYFEPPHEQQVKMRLSGAEALPLPGAQFDLKTMRVEKFSAEGKLEAVVEAPRCVFAPMDSVASSAGRLALRSGDGKFRVEGEGFLWLQNDQFLVISNHVRTVIEFTPAKPDKS